VRGSYLHFINNCCRYPRGHEEDQRSILGSPRVGPTVKHSETTYNKLSKQFLAKIEDLSLKLFFVGAIFGAAVTETIPASY